VRLRAIIRTGSLTLVPAELATVCGGPIGCLARAAVDSGVSVADLAFGADDEENEEDVEVDAEEPQVADGERAVEVRFIANETPAARRAIGRWAARAGHRRIWFRDQVVDLEPPPGIDGEHATTCPTCGLEISDGGPELIGFVHAAGHFPLNCFVCGAFVPQWEPVGPDRLRGRRSATEGAAPELPEPTRGRWGGGGVREPL